MTNKTALLVYSLAILAIFVMAYLSMLPLHLITVRWFDSLGHFVLYGLWGYFFGKAYPRLVIDKAVFTVSVGIAICTAIAILEECLQYLSPYRSFTLSDMALSLLGILTAAGYLNYIRNKKFT